MKESCPFTIRGPSSPMEGKPKSERAGDGTTQPTKTREVHDTHGTMPASGLPEDYGTGTDDDRYGPWMLVTRRKVGQRRTNSVNTHVGLGSQPHDKRQGQLGGSKEWVNGMDSVYNGPHNKRQGQLSGPKEWVNGMGKMYNGPFEVGREDNISKEGVSVRPNIRTSASVKSKKDIARNKATKWNVKEDAGSSGKGVVNNALKWSSLNTIGDVGKLGDQVQFSTTSGADVGKPSWKQSGDGGQRKDRDVNNHESGLGVESLATVAGSGERVEVGLPNITNPNFVQEVTNEGDLEEKDADRPYQHQAHVYTHNNARGQRSSGDEGIGYGCPDTLADFVPRKGENRGEFGGDGMELEVESEATTLC